MKLIKRTPEEMKAYVEGFTACNKRFKEYLTGRYTIKDAIQKMDLIVSMINTIINKEVET